MSTPTLAGSCQHCHNGYRPDFFGLDHYGMDTPAIRACEAGTTPCPDHACYWADRHAVSLVKVTSRTYRPGDIVEYIGGDWSTWTGPARVAFICERGTVALDTPDASAYGMTYAMPVMVRPYR